MDRKIELPQLVDVEVEVSKGKAGLVFAEVNSKETILIEEVGFGGLAFLRWTRHVDKTFPPELGNR